MLNAIARVFSSQGVLIQGSEAVPVPRREAGSACAHDTPDCGCFAPVFDQAAAKLELSRQALALQAGGPQPGENGGQGEGEARHGKDGGAAARDGAGESGIAAARRDARGKPLDEGEEKQVRELEKRDREVRAHEAAHQAAAGGHAKGGASFEYQTGPDGRQYAVGGHVDIDLSPVQGNPQATLQKAMAVQRAGLAPADPSGQDRSVAASASSLALQARKEMAESRQGGATDSRGPGRVAGYAQSPRAGAIINAYA